MTTLARSLDRRRHLPRVDTVPMSIARRLLVLLIGSIGLIDSPTRAGEPSSPPTIIVRGVRPDRVVEALIHLFNGSRAAHPAAALAAWKRASVEPKRLGKVGDALLATINPAMVREVANLDETRVAFSPIPGSDRWAWWACFPRDDGTLAALAPTAALSGGGEEPPLGESRVDRFPGTDLILLGRGPAGLFAANSRDRLAAAIQAAATVPPPPPIDSGFLVEVDPTARATWTTPAGRRWAEAARSTDCQGIAARVQVAGTSLVASVTGRFAGAIPALGAIDPAWLDGIPTRGPLAALVVRVDPSAGAWNRWFDLADRIERTDPERANIAPARLRLALAALAIGVRLEANVWPHLVGVAAWVGMTDGKLDRGSITLHLDDPTAAANLAASLKGRRVQDGGDEVVELAQVAGQPLRLVRRGGGLFITWGDQGWPATRQALDDPGRSARSWLGSSRSGAVPSRVGAIWLDQLPQVPPGSPLAASLAAAPPLRWSGGNDGNLTIDEFWVDDLDATVRRFLDLIPQDPPPRS